jgi:hypothetical protein
MWKRVNRSTGGFYQRTDAPHVTMHSVLLHPRVWNCTHTTFFMLEPNGVTELDARDLYSALDEADALVNSLPVDD